MRSCRWHWLALLALAGAAPVCAQVPSSDTAAPDVAAAWVMTEGSDAGAESRAANAGLLDNLSVDLGLNGSKEPEDLGINANFGLRAAVNWGLPLWEDYGLGFQVGTSVNYSRTAVRVLRFVDGTRDRWDNFSTGGVFQRTGFGLNWGLVYDFADERYYDTLTFGQWRGQVGYDVTANDEAGVWGAWREHGDASAVGGEAFSLRPIFQGNLFWRHTWANDIVTRAWVGLAEEHGRFVLVAPGESPVHHPIVFGAEVFVPLNDFLAIYGEANFITPNDSGTVTAFFGVAFYPGGGTHSAPHSRFAPYLPLANNPSFAIDLRQ